MIDDLQVRIRFRALAHAFPVTPHQLTRRLRPATKTKTGIAGAVRRIGNIPPGFVDQHAAHTAQQCVSRRIVPATRPVQRDRRHTVAGRHSSQSIGNGRQRHEPRRRHRTRVGHSGAA
jgi:hypothetical protein